MTTINANLTRMPEVSVLGFPALFIPQKVNRNTVHLGLYQYELSGNLSDPSRILIVTNDASEEFCGTLLSFAPLLMEGVSMLILDSRDLVVPQKAEYYTPAEFEQKYYRG